MGGIPAASRIAAEGVVDGSQNVGAVLGGGGDVPADGVPVAGDLLSERRRPEIFCSGLGGPQFAFGLMRVYHIRPIVPTWGLCRPGAGSLAVRA